MSGGRELQQAGGRLGCVRARTGALKVAASVLVLVPVLVDVDVDVLSKTHTDYSGLNVGRFKPRRW